MWDCLPRTDFSVVIVEDSNLYAHYCTIFLVIGLSNYYLTSQTSVDVSSLRTHQWLFSYLQCYKLCCATSSLFRVSRTKQPIIVFNSMITSPVYHFFGTLTLYLSSLFEPDIIHTFVLLVSSKGIQLCSFVCHKTHL